MAPPKINVRTAQRNLESLFKLLGGTAEDRQRFFEIVLGITSRREAVLVNAHLESIAVMAKQLETDSKALQSAARQKG